MEKRRVSEESKQESEKSYLDKNNVNELIADLLAQLTANRPEDPFHFMSAYFDQTPTTQVNKVEKCHDLLTLTHHSMPAYQRNVYQAYEVLSTHKISKGLFGVNGVVFSQLIDLLTSNMGTSGIRIKQILKIRPIDSITFSYFNSAVTYILIVSDYLQMARSLFNIMEVKVNNSVDKIQCESIASLLSKSLSNKTDGDNPELESLYLLSPENVHRTLSESSARSDGKTTLTEEQFIELVFTTISPILVKFSK